VIKVGEKQYYAFIDTQNLYLGIMSQGWELDFKKFRIYLKEKYFINRAFLFIGYLPDNEILYAMFKKFGYDLIFKPTVTSGKNNIKGNVDAELVLHTMLEYNNYDKAMIISGNGDFCCLIEYLKKKDKLLKLMVPNMNRFSSLLKGSL
jgi:uncharacterized LabA/DUF88 family protein